MPSPAPGTDSPPALVQISHWVDEWIDGRMDRWQADLLKWTWWSLWAVGGAYSTTKGRKQIKRKSSMKNLRNPTEV